MPLDLLLKCQVITYLIASICVKYEKLALPCKFLTGYYWGRGDLLCSISFTMWKASNTT